MNKIDGDMYVSGRLVVGAFATPNGSLGDVNFGSADPLTVTKQLHQYVRTYAQKHGSATVTERMPLHVAHGVGNVQEVGAGIVVAAVGGATVVVDLKKNGTTILSGTITLNSSTVVYALAVAGITGGGVYAAGDVFEVVVTATAGGGTIPQGLFVKVVFREAAQ